MLKKIFLFVSGVVLLLACVIGFKAFRFSSKQRNILAKPLPNFSDTTLRHLQQALRYRTISYANKEQIDSTQFLGFRKFLETTYPLFHKNLKREIFEGYTLLYKWEGKNSNLKPAILMAHQDVVPIEEATKTMWTADPFAGIIKDNFIWGRGTTDDKLNLISVMEACEKLLLQNFQPERTIFFSFGHDEELGGKGAKAVAKYLKDQNISAELIIDEGGIVTREKIPGLNKSVALLGTAEKGYLSVELSVEKNGGHSSMPDEETSVDILAKALVHLRAKPFVADFSEPMQGFVDYVGPEMPYPEKLIFANQWLFKKVIIGIYEKSPQGNAMVRTTMVPTIIHSGIKDNVVPTVAKATVNLRLLPGTTTAQAIEQVKEKINDDRVKLEANALIADPTSVSPLSGFGYQKIDEAVKQSGISQITTPFLMIGATDSRHFGAISKDIIKFSPMIDPIGFHGIDERVSLESYRYSLWFYEQLLEGL